MERVRFAMKFPKSSDEEAFYKAWNSYIIQMWHSDNPENKTRLELEELYWTRFCASHWCWEKHVLIPEEKPEPPRRPWRYEVNKDGIRGNNVFEVYFEETKEWKVIDKSGKVKNY